MKKRVAGTMWAGLLALSFAGPVGAALFDRGGGLIYDDLLDITWLQNANYGAGSAYDDGTSTTDGKMTWDNAVAWAASLTVGATRTWTEPGSFWRLPTIVDTGTPGCNSAYSGTDCGYNVQTGSAATTVYSEMASLWYDTLGNKGYYDTSGDYQPGYGLTNPGPFDNLESYAYWSGTEYAPNTNGAWDFNTYYGFQTSYYKFGYHYAWAVRSGDVSAVPVPAAVWLFGSGLIGLLGVARRKR